MNNIISNGSWMTNAEVVDAPMTIEEALKGAQADFQVKGEDMYYLDKHIKDLIAQGNDIPSWELIKYLKKVEGKQANVRTDTMQCLGVVSDNYGIVQNETAFNFVNLLCNGSDDAPRIDSAGTLNDGKRVFISAHFGDIAIGDNKNDRVQMNVVATTSHDGSGAVQVAITPVRIACQNMLNIAFKNASGKISFRHTSNVNHRLDLLNKENADFVCRTLKLKEVYEKEFRTALDRLASLKMTEKDIEKALVVSLLPKDAVEVYNKNNCSLNTDEISTRSKNIIYNVFDAMHGGIGQSELESGNGLWVVNGLTTYYQNYANYNDNNQKCQSTLDGTANKKLQSLYDTLMKVA